MGQRFNHWYNIAFDIVLYAMPFVLIAVLVKILVT